MKGYKAFHFDLSCRPTPSHVMHYRVGETYEREKPLILCCRGFHFCPSLYDVYSYYKASFDTRICEVEALGDWEPKSALKALEYKRWRFDRHTKIVTDRLHVIRELTPAEIKEAVLDDAPKSTVKSILHSIHVSLEEFDSFPESYSLWEEGDHYRTACSDDERKALHERADLWEAALSGMPFVKEKEKKP